MCDKCHQKVAYFLSTQLSAPLPDIIPEHDVEEAVRAVQTACDIAKLLDILIPSIPEGTPDPDSAMAKETLSAMGANRIANVIQFCGHFASLFEDVNAMGVAAMQGMAKGGNVGALFWLATHADGLQARDEGDDDDDTPKIGMFVLELKPPTPPPPNPFTSARRRTKRPSDLN